MASTNISAAETITVCFNLIDSANSHGILNSKGKEDGYLSHSLPLLELQMGLIFIISHTLHFLLKRWGLSLFVSSMLAGIIIGPTVLGQYDFMRESIFPQQSQFILNMISIIGTQFFLFLSAVKMEVETLFKSGRKEISIGISSVAIPFIFGLAYKRFANEHINFSEDLPVIGVQSFTNFAVVAYLMNNLRISNSELGRLVLSSALVADSFGISTTFIACMVSENGKGCSSREISGIIMIILAAAFVFRPTMLWVIRRTPRGMPISNLYICITIGLTLLTGLYFLKFHMALFVAPFILGFSIPSGPPLGSVLVDKFEAVTLGVFLPIEVATAVMRAEFYTVIYDPHLGYFIGILVFLFAAKWIACVIPTLFYRIPILESFALAFLMSCKGIIELESYVLMKDCQTLPIPVFAILTLYILLSSTIFPILVKRLYNPSRKYVSYKARTVASLRPESELRILTCIHKPDDVPSTFRLLDTTHPTKQRPIDVCVLHLIELIGRSTPVFVYHEKNKPVQDHYSRNVILNFNHYKQNNPDVVSIDAFTAISPAKLMHEDVCSLALNKVTSLILIPLHGMWSSTNTFIDPESINLKNLTLNVLQEAPCSVGIFLDRSKHGYQAIKSSKGAFQSLCMIFLGGADDREALALAKRMARNSHTSLTVIQFIMEEGNFVESEDAVFDIIALKEFKRGFPTSLSIGYKQRIVKDGPETALAVHSMANDYDLFIVGRRYGIASPQTEGLLKWSEFPEIGIIGDLLASKDLNTAASLLVVQQQKQFKNIE